MDALSSMFSSFYQGASHLITESTFSAGFSNHSAQKVSDILREFFKALYYHPEEKILTIAILVVIVVALFVGIFFLIKKIWERYFAD